MPKQNLSSRQKAAAGNPSKADPAASQSEAEAGLSRLLGIMRRLRDPETGCPWDIEQTFATIAPYTIEEAYEVADAIERRDWDALPDELGDLLLQVVFHAQMAAEQERFGFADVCRRINDKLIRRHPHVFPPDGEERAEFDAEQQTRHWERLKHREREHRGNTSLLDEVPAGLPELARSLKLQKRAARVGFDWPDPQAVMAKLDEEIEELKAAGTGGDPERIFDELGDLLFVMVNLARKHGVDPGAALRHANAKFERRFRGIEQLAAKDDVSLQEMSLERMEELWQQCKRDGIDQRPEDR